MKQREKILKKIGDSIVLEVRFRSASYLGRLVEQQVKTKELKAKFKGYDIAIEEVCEEIDAVDLELMLTDIKDKEGNKVELSDEIMQLITIWWEEQSKKLKDKIKGK